MVVTSRANFIFDIDDDLLARIFLYLPEASDRELCGCVNRQWLRVSRAEHDGRWAQFCWKDLHLRHPTGASSPDLWASAFCVLVFYHLGKAPLVAICVVFIIHERGS
jgi:hypothetical protein